MHIGLHTDIYRYTWTHIYIYAFLPTYINRNIMITFKHIDRFTHRYAYTH